MSLTDLSYLYTIFSLDHKITLLLEFLPELPEQPQRQLQLQQPLLLL